MDRNTIELKVKVININVNKSHELLDKCNILKEYSQFIDMVRKYPNEKDSIKQAIYECIEHGILADYLKRKGSEVTNMLIAEYNYEEDIEVKQEEARQEGEKIGEQRGMRKGEKIGKRIGERRGKKNGILLSGKIFQEIKKNPALTDRQTAKAVGCTIEDVRNVRKMFEI